LKRAQPIKAVWELYGLKPAEKEDGDSAAVIDLEVESISSEGEGSKKPIEGKRYFDEGRGLPVIALSCGQVVESTLCPGPLGFQRGIFPDGSFLDTEIPNIAGQAGATQNGKAKAKGKGKAKSKGKAAPEAKAKGKAGGKAKAKAKASAKGKAKAESEVDSSSLDAVPTPSSPVPDGPATPSDLPEEEEEAVQDVPARVLCDAYLKDGTVVPGPLRQQLRPEGCGKCRHVVGCTPSCWAGRSKKCLE
jgi:hypothetical protein